MAFLPRPVTTMMSWMPEATASSMTYWIVGLSTIGNISLGWALVAGRKRVPSPAAGNTAFRIVIASPLAVSSGKSGHAREALDLHVDQGTRLEQPGQEAPDQADEDGAQNRAAEAGHVHALDHARHQDKHSAIDHQREE